MWASAYETMVRLGAFAGIFAVLALGEWARPRRGPGYRRRPRWGSNLALVALNTLLVRLVFVGGAVGAALFAAERGWGVLRLVSLPGPVAVVLAVIALDLLVYLQHVLFHAIPALWRLHRVHHADRDFDLTTGIRFHPLEILLSMALKAAGVLLLGPPAVAVLVFEVLLNGTSLFNHSNLRLPPRLDRGLRWIVVTPDMHRVHHSVRGDEVDRNFGFNLPWWDRLLGTYRAQPRDGHQGMTIGVPGLEAPAWTTRLDRMLVLPFTRGAPRRTRGER